MKAKHEEFSQLVAVSLQAAFQGPLQRPDLAASDRTDLAFLLADLLQEARQVAARIPPRLSLIDAAKDFIAYATDGGPHWYEPPDRPIPAKWMGLRENKQVQCVFGGVQEKIDGRWQSENPEWQGLPYSESATLRLLAHLRRVRTASRDELEDVLRPFGGGDVEAALCKPVKEAWVARSGDDRTAKWSATELLLPNEAPPACRSTEPAHLPRDLAAERRRARQLRLSRLPDKPDARALLIELRKHKQMKAHELRPLLPHLDRNATVRLLKQLREAGWLEVVGTTKNAEWRATEKLRTVDFRRRNALAIS